MNGLGFLLIIVAFAFLWLVMVRPQKRRQQDQRRMLDNLRVGDEVLSAGGIFGEIVALRDDEVVVEIAPGTEVRLARRAIGGVTPREEADPEPDEAGEPDEPDEPDEAEEGELEPAGEGPADENRR